LNLGAFWSEMIESSQNQLLISDNSLPQFVELCTISLPQWVQMTVSFIHRHQDCRHCSLSAPGELSRMLHSMQLIAQLHRRSQKGFQLMTQAGFLTNSCLKDGLCHRDLDPITGKIAHLSVSSQQTSWGCWRMCNTLICLQLATHRVSSCGTHWVVSKDTLLTKDALLSVRD